MQAVFLTGRPLLNPCYNKLLHLEHVGGGYNMLLPSRSRISGSYLYVNDQGTLDTVVLVQEKP